MADFLVILSEAAGAAGEAHADPTAFGLNATVWVSIAMLAFLGHAAAAGANASDIDGRKSCHVPPQSFAQPCLTSPRNTASAHEAHVKASPARVSDNDRLG